MQNGLTGQNQAETVQNQAKIGLKFAKRLNNLATFYAIWLKLVVEFHKGKVQYMHTMNEDFGFADWLNRPKPVLKWQKFETITKV